MISGGLGALGKRPIGLVFLLLAVFFGGGTLTVLLVVPFSALTPIADSLAVSGHSTAFTTELYGKLRTNLIPFCLIAFAMGSDIVSCLQSTNRPIFILFLQR